MGSAEASLKPLLVRYAVIPLVTAAVLDFVTAWYPDLVLVWILLFSPIFAALAISVIAVLAWYLNQWLGGGWRWVFSLCAILPMSVGLLPTYGTLRPYLKLAVHYTRYMKEIHSLSSEERDFHIWTWTEDIGFAPPELALIYNESDSLTRSGADVYQPKNDMGWWSCRGHAYHLYGHFYVCSTDNLPH